MLPKYGFLDEFTFLASLLILKDNFKSLLS